VDSSAKKWIGRPGPADINELNGKFIFQNPNGRRRVEALDFESAHNPEIL
jgi:hypothetical protein